MNPLNYPNSVPKNGPVSDIPLASRGAMELTVASKKGRFTKTGSNVPAGGRDGSTKHPSNGDRHMWAKISN